MNISVAEKHAGVVSAQQQKAPLAQRELTRRSLFRNTAQLATLLAAGPALAAGSRLRAPASFEEYRQYSALQLGRMVRRGEADAGQLLEIAIARAEAVNPALNFMAAPLYERARMELKHAAPREGMFPGVPFLLKDLGAHLRGAPMTHGSMLFRNYISSHTSTLVQRYLDAGVVIFGRTTSPELGGSAATESRLHGATRNPWNRAYSSGGSSGGAAVAVSTGVVPVAHATDGGGSIRIPASCCGLFGLKPSRSRTPYGPRHLRSSGDLAVGHVISRSVADSAAFLDISWQPEPGITHAPPPPSRSYLSETRSRPKKLRIAMLRTVVGFKMHADSKAAMEDAAQLCRELGHEVVEAELQDLDREKIVHAFGVFMGSNALQAVQAVERQRGKMVAPEELEPLMYLRVAGTRNYSADDYRQALHTRDAFTRYMDLFMRDYDLVLTPTLGAPPPRIGLLALDRPPEQFARDIFPYGIFTGLYNLSGQPAMSVPLHWNKQQLPIGVMFAARIGAEATLLNLAGTLEEARPWKDRLPPV